MMQLMRFALVVALVPGCKGKDTNATSAKPTDPAPLVSPAPVAVVAPAAAAVLNSGSLTLGCVAWSEKLETAACVIGTRGTGREPSADLLSVGSTAVSVSLGQPVAAEDADSANDALAANGFAPLSGAAIALEENTQSVGKATVTFSQRTTNNTQARDPRHISAQIIAKCGTASEQIFSFEADEVAVKATVRTVGDFAIFEIDVHTGREGENSDAIDAVTLDTTS
ncbi:hypothetical protein BH11MYX2_BH11MYX2_26550 [soil metagenome]